MRLGRCGDDRLAGPVRLCRGCRRGPGFGLIVQRYSVSSTAQNPRQGSPQGVYRTLWGGAGHGADVAVAGGVD